VLEPDRDAGDEVLRYRAPFRGSHARGGLATRRAEARMLPGSDRVQRETRYDRCSGACACLPTDTGAQR
jgi:hypothetical protein